jgi:hypothetical protein
MSAEHRCGTTSGRILSPPRRYRTSSCDQSAATANVLACPMNVARNKFAEMSRRDGIFLQHNGDVARSKCAARISLAVVMNFAIARLACCRRVLPAVSTQFILIVPPDRNDERDHARHT